MMPAQIPFNVKSSIARYPYNYILTDLGQRNEPFSDHSLNSILQ